MKPVLWAEQTSEDIAAMRADGVDMVLFPLASTQPFGPHLPLCTGTLLAEVVAHAVSARTAVPVLPALCFGSAGLSPSWPGALPLRPELLAQVVQQVLVGVVSQGFSRVLILSGDTDEAIISGALRSVRARFAQSQVACKYLGHASPRARAAFVGDGIEAHGGAAHTALMLHLAPHLVRRERVFDEPDRGASLIFDYEREHLSEQGHIGSPTQATAERGAELFEALVSDWTYVVRRALIEKPPLDRGADTEAAPVAPPRVPELEAAPGLFRAPLSEAEPD